MIRHNAVYVRKSSDPQEEKSQIEGVRSYLERHGITVPADYWFEDTGSRHHSETRQDFQRLLKLVQDDRIANVYCWKQNRIGTKNHKEWFHFSYVFEQHGSKIIDAINGKDLTKDDVPTAVETLMEAEGSKKFQQDLADNVLREMVSRAREGQPQSKIPPFGYDKLYTDSRGQPLWSLHHLDNGRFLVTMPDGSQFERDKPPRKSRGDRIRYIPSINKERVEIVRYLFDAYASASITTRALAIELNRQGKRRYGRPWSRTTVEYILCNPAYVGSVRYNHTSQAEFSRFDGQKLVKANNPGRKSRRNDPHEVIITPDAHEGIVDRRLFDRVGGKLAQRRRVPAPPRRAELYLRGILFCGKCGRPMHCTTIRGKAGYLCAAYYRFNQHHAEADNTGCTRNWIPHERAERLVLDRLGEMAAKLSTADEGQALRGILEQHIDATFDFKMTMVRGVGEYLKHMLQFFRECGSWERFERLLGKIASVEGHIRDKDLERCIDELTVHPQFDMLSVEQIRKAFLVFEEEKVKLAKARLDGLKREFSEWLRAKGRADSDRELSTATARIKAIEEQLTVWESRAKPLDDQLAELRTLLTSQKKAIREAQKSLSRLDHRRKAETLRGLFQRIVLHFRAVPKARIVDCALEEEKTEFVSAIFASSTR